MHIGGIDAESIAAASRPKRSAVARAGDMVDAAQKGDLEDKAMHKPHYRIILLTLLGISWQGVLAADTAESIPPPLTYLHVYADAAGASHFREEHFNFSRGRDGDNSIHVMEAKGGATLLRLKAGAVEDWHNAPRAWFLIVLQGASEVTTSDGQKRRFGPGSVVLLDDTTGKGHRTRAIGKVDHIAAVIPVADDAPVTGVK
jgi:quercetin dioxygenase-like cupin family protein